METALKFADSPHDQSIKKSQGINAKTKAGCLAAQLLNTGRASSSPVSPALLPPGAVCCFIGCAADFADFVGKTSVEITDSLSKVGCLFDQEITTAKNTARTDTN